MSTKTIEQRIEFIERVFWVVGILAVVFGVSGAWGLSLLNSAKDEISALRIQLESEGEKITKVREEIVPIQEFVTNSRTLVDASRLEIERATKESLSSVGPAINDAISRIAAQRQQVSATVSAVRDITALGQHNFLSLTAKKGDLIVATYSASARSGEFYYKLVSPNDTAEPLAADAQSSQVVQLTNEPWRSISANQIFRARSDGGVRLAVEYFKSDVTGVVRVFGSTLSAHVLR